MTDFSLFETRLMGRLLRLAAKRRGLTGSTPMVACALLQDGKVIAEGVHQKEGTPHAEAIALAKAGDAAKGATLYVNLAPCTHWGANPPCASLIQQAGIKEVVYAMSDPNPLVAKNPSELQLLDMGIQVRTGLLEADAKRLNEVFIHYQKFQRPFVHLKVAQSLDGKIAAANGESLYITNTRSRRQVHRFRRESDAVLIGINSLIMDDAQLSVRFGLIRGGYRHPKVVILDRRGRLHGGLRLFQRRVLPEVIVVTLPGVQLHESVRNRVTQVTLASEDVLEMWPLLLDYLGQEGIQSLLIEGGAEVYSSALLAGIVDKVSIFMAPILMAQSKALSAFHRSGHLGVSESRRLTEMTMKQLGSDLWVTGYLRDPASI